MVEMRLASLRVEITNNTPVVMLREKAGERPRTLPILIGQPEASSIALHLQDIRPPRPLTHDLIGNLLADLGATLERVVVTDLKENPGGIGGTFYAEMHVLLGGRVVTVSARPSDAIAVAIRTGTPIFAEDGLLDAEGVFIEEDDDPVDEDAPPEEEIVHEFRRFIDDVRPEDFAS